MLISYKWLSNYVDFSQITPQELAEKITRAGIEVDVIHHRTARDKRGGSWSYTGMPTTS